jgi:hypothetical protein
VEDIKQKGITIFPLGIWKARRDVQLVTFSSSGTKMYCPCCKFKLRTRSFRGWEMRKKYRELAIKGY